MKAVRFVGRNGSTSRRYRRALRDDTILSTTADDHRNIAMQFTCGGRRMTLGTSRTLRDFVDLAACIYILDVLEERASQADSWTRDFELTYPVSDVDVWRNAGQHLTSGVEFLSGDRFDFHFVRGTALGSIGRGRQVDLQGFDVVCLFSGGADSFLGACELLKADKRVLLVGHYADGISSSAQTDLYESIVNEFSSEQVQLVQCHMNISRIRDGRHPLKAVERSHRTRSLMFLALGTALASISATPSLAIPENGLIALNPPLGVSRIGSLSTRTAHPRFLAAYRAAVSELGVSQSRLYNPFSFLNKNDVVAGSDETFHEALLRTVSCSRAGRVRIYSEDPNVRHCGFCVPCLYRRSAFAAAGLDDPSDYARDAFGGFADLSGTQRRDFRSLVRLAKRLSRSSDAQLDAVIVQQGSFAPDEVDSGEAVTDDYAPWRRMLRNWSGDFLAQVRADCSREVCSALSV